MSLNFSFVKHPDKLDNTDADETEHSFHAWLLHLESCDEGDSDKEHCQTVNSGEKLTAYVLAEAVEKRDDEGNACNGKSLVNLADVLGFFLSDFLGDIEISESYNGT